MVRRHRDMRRIGRGLRGSGTPSISAAAKSATPAGMSRVGTPARNLDRIAAGSGSPCLGLVDDHLRQRTGRMPSVAFATMCAYAVGGPPRSGRGWDDPRDS